MTAPAREHGNAVDSLGLANETIGLGQRPAPAAVWVQTGPFEVEQLARIGLQDLDLPGRGSLSRRSMTGRGLRRRAISVAATQKRDQGGQVSSVLSIADQVFGGLTDQQMRARPAKGLNSLVWLLRHMESESRMLA